MSSIQPKLIDLVEIQKQVLKEILDAKLQTGEIKSTSEYDTEMDYLLAKLQNKEPFMKVRPQSGLTNPESYNTSFEELAYDMQVIFAEVNQIDETINKHQRLNQSVVNNLKLRIKKMDEDLIKYERLAEIRDTSKLYLETFIDNNNFESDGAYYTDRNGTLLPNPYYAKLDTQGEAIKLPTILSDNTMIGPGGVRLGTISIIKQLGSELIRITNPENEVDKAIDSNYESFWSESILVDAPITVPMGPDYYNIDFGALVELEIRFDYLTQLNEIGMSVFGEYPLDIVSVSYFTTDNDSEMGIPFIYPNSTNTGLKSRIIEGSTSFQFTDIYAKRLRIVFNQRHYVKSDFIASQKNQKFMDLWFNNKEREIEIDTDGLIFTPVYRDQVEENPNLYRFSKAVNSTDDIETIIKDFDNDAVKSINKFEYNYGLYNLSINKNEYQNTGIYVSGVIDVDSSVKSVRIISDEEHPLVDGLPRFTDIEYSIYDGDTWHPILPTNALTVEAELLLPSLVGSDYQAKTAFVVTSGLVVRKNGVVITASLGVDHQTVTFTDYDVSASYTASYVPVSSAREIDFLQLYTGVDGVVPRRLVETFQGADNKNAVQLRYYPFVDKARLNAQPLDYNPNYLSNELDANGYLPIKVTLIDVNGYHITQPRNASDTGIRVDNVTDYFDESNSILSTYDETKNTYYQYKVLSNRIEFNQPIPATTKVIVEYPYLIGDIRVKAVLRRNIHGFYGLTPVLNEYVAQFQSLI